MKENGDDNINNKKNKKNTNQNTSSKNNNIFNSTTSSTRTPSSTTSRKNMETCIKYKTYNTASSSVSKSKTFSMNNNSKERKKRELSCIKNTASRNDVDNDNILCWTQATPVSSSYTNIAYCHFSLHAQHELRNDSKAGNSCLNVDEIAKKIEHRWSNELTQQERYYWEQVARRGKISHNHYGISRDHDIGNDSSTKDIQVSSQNDVLSDDKLNKIEQKTKNKDSFKGEAENSEKTSCIKNNNNGSPSKPKKKKTAYLFFAQESRPKIRRLEIEQETKNKDSFKGEAENSEKTPCIKNNNNGSPSKPKKPKTAYLYFAQESRPKIRRLNPDFTGREVTRAVGRAWINLNILSRIKYSQLEAQGMDEYSNAMKKWKNECNGKS